MSQASSKEHCIQVELPEEAFRGRTLDAQEIAQELRLLWLLEEVRARRLGFGKAAELAGLPQARFLDLMGEHHISPFDYDAEELARELRSRP
jgi:predicted HTH domain antitoxin